MRRCDLHVGNSMFAALSSLVDNRPFPSKTKIEAVLRFRSWEGIRIMAVYKLRFLLWKIKGKIETGALLWGGKTFLPLLGEG